MNRGITVFALLLAASLLLAAGVEDGALVATSKIDDQATLGLNGVHNSLAYRVHEIEKHVHSFSSWFEAATTPNGEIHVADRIGDGAGAFQIDAGNDTWGAWVQILGSSDTPARAGHVKFDPHEIVVVATEKAATYFIQIAHGASGAAGYSAGEYTEVVYESDSVGAKAAGITDVQSERITAGDKLWARCLAPGEATATIDFYLGMHEYPGN